MGNRHLSVGKVLTRATPCLLRNGDELTQARPSHRNQDRDRPSVGCACAPGTFVDRNALCVAYSITQYLTDLPNATAKKTCHIGMPNMPANANAGGCVNGEAVMAASAHRPACDTHSCRWSQCFELISSGIVASSHGTLTD